MARKKWTPKEEITPDLLKFREKRKWQITFRRYVLQKTPCPTYAPFFGLDIQRIRNWFEVQFTGGMNWENFGTVWQFDHIVPVMYFDHNDEQDLRLCWNFTNLRVNAIEKEKEETNSLDLIGAKAYYKTLFENTAYEICRLMLEKLEQIEATQVKSSIAMQAFVGENKDYLQMIENYSVFEFELLNSGRPIEEVKREIELFRQMGAGQ